MNEIINRSIKSFTAQRVRLDMHKDAIKRLPASRGTSLAFTALEEGRMWIGEMCRELGHAYPYEATKEATDASGIQEAVDVSDKGYEIDGNEIIALNDLRDYLEKECDQLQSIYFKRKIHKLVIETEEGRFRLTCAFTEAYQGLKETRMWLGIRLGEIRDNDVTPITEEDEEVNKTYNNNDLTIKDLLGSEEEVKSTANKES